jgi:hypothetical protein
MKKYLFGTLMAIGMLFSLTAGTVMAAGEPELSPPPGISKAGPYEGVFYGKVYGDNNSSALMAMQLIHREGVVEGKVYLGEGLYVDAGMCGNNEIPSLRQYASGMTNPNNPNELTVQTMVNVSGFDIGVELNSMVSGDGETLTAEASIDLPWICGSDPSFTGTLDRLW